MEEQRGIYHENDVTHDKLDGDLEYQPIWKGARRVPILPQYPDNVTVPVLDASRMPGYQSTDLTGMYGVAANYGVTRAFPGYAAQQRAFQRNPEEPSKWSFFEVRSFASTNTVISAFKVEMRVLKKLSPSTMQVVYDQTDYAVPMSGIQWPGWNDSASYDAIVSLCQSFPVRSVESGATEANFYGKADFSSVLSPSSARDKIDSLVSMFFPDVFPIEDVDYGDLAMTASQKVNANKTNMIAFLRDLRKPKELIPKLRELRNLAGVANNYLTVSYGILPTIDDIKSIVEAFKKMAPYVDRNGFSTYGASSTNQSEVDGFTYRLEQRIKLAIDDNDNDFYELIQRVESWGFLPTFENVWDLVPYSFVVDWLVDVGGFLQRVDTHLRLVRLNIRYATMSRKTNVKGTFVPTPDAPFNGSIEWVHYHRWVSDQCPVPPLSLKPTFQDFDHWLESGALLAQRTKL
jgi:hypothetical protein